MSIAKRSGSAATTDGSERYRRIAAFVESSDGTSTTSTRAGRGARWVGHPPSRGPPDATARAWSRGRTSRSRAPAPDRRALPRELGRWRRDRADRHHGEQRGDGGREAREVAGMGRNGSTSAKQDGSRLRPFYAERRRAVHPTHRRGGGVGRDRRRRRSSSGGRVVDPVEPAARRRHPRDLCRREPRRCALRRSLPTPRARADRASGSPPAASERTDAARRCFVRRHWLRSMPARRSCASASTGPESALGTTGSSASASA